MITIENHLNNHLAQSLPFVLYAKPNSQKLIGYFQQDYQIYSTINYTDSGFVFAPFDGEENIFFSIENCEVVTDSIADLQVDFAVFNDVQPSQAVKQNHMQLVQQGIDAIVNNEIKKVVLSRKETLAITDMNFLLYYKRLLKAYPTAFRYLFFHPQVGFWMGATPEQLVKQHNDAIETVALAATQVKMNIEDVVWSEKEIEEQKVVTDFIIQNLKPFVTELQLSQPYTAQAGTLFHIKTDIKAKLAKKEYFVNVLTALHPTPALCGYPKQEAKKFILSHENYDREFYAGFLGELHYNPLTKQTNESDIFVNLRCMQLESNKVHLYVGGGIMAQSNPEAEFVETINKSKTIKKILGS
ncbi:isochorismate synthase [Flavobacterium agricola]|uniref:isochorismate synthase n=1 Tax=Flavobacterium agricola TaxID=2870839 RepID=A0ABY6M1C1_9FLAO|nr:isochorismate synthase [Flavobacterium agricola]UYW02362.1 isochorismate synthase [Flavobacterium agricola]